MIITLALALAIASIESGQMRSFGSDAVAASNNPYPDSSVSRREVEIDNGVWTRIGVDEQVKLDIVSDDRCPEGLLCEWAGMARFRIAYRGARGFSSEAEIGFPGQPDAATRDAVCMRNRRIELAEVMPSTRKGLVIEPHDYRVRLILGQCGESTEMSQNRVFLEPNPQKRP